MFGHGVTEKKMKSLYEFVRLVEEENGRGSTDMLETARRGMFILNYLAIIAAHFMAVAPKNRSPVPKVSLVRTYVKDDRVMKYINRRRRGDRYDGIHLLWSRIFANMPLNIGTDVPFSSKRASPKGTATACHAGRCIVLKLTFRTSPRSVGVLQGWMCSFFGERVCHAGFLYKPHK